MFGLRARRKRDLIPLSRNIVETGGLCHSIITVYSAPVWKDTREEVIGMSDTKESGFLVGLSRLGVLVSECNYRR